MGKRIVSNSSVNIGGTHNKTTHVNDLPFGTFTKMIPILLALISPLIMYGRVLTLSNKMKLYSLGKEAVLDVFLYAKGVVIFIAAALALFMMLCFKLLERKIFYKEKFLIFLGVYLLVSFISAFFAYDKGVAFRGGEELFEGFFVILSYAIVFYYTYLLVRRDESAKNFILYTVLIVSILLSIIGTLQIARCDPFKILWIKKLLNFKGANVASASKVYMTLYNPNYVGVMGVLLIPTLITGAIVNKSKVLKSVFIVAAILMGVCTYKSGSKGALVAIVIVAFVCFAIFLYGRKGDSYSRNEKLIRIIVGVCALLVMVASSVALVRMNPNNFFGLDSSYNRQKASATKVITNKGEDGKIYYKVAGRWSKAVESEDALPKDFYSFASNRGFVWSKTIPKLKDNLIVGCGMDHFVKEFPNDDYKSKESIGQVYTMYNKPHNYYLKVGIESGVVGMISIIGFLFVMIIGMFKKQNRNNPLIVGLGCSILGYIIMMFVNDSMVVTAPVFWVITGVYAGLLTRQNA